MMMRYALPACAFVVLVALLAIGLNLDPRHVPSPLIDKPIPEFALPDLADKAVTVTADALTGKPRLLNVWASWCNACRIEHPLLVSLAQSRTVELIGLNYKDELAKAQQWLHEHGDPYARSIFDKEGRLGLDLGVYGVPETFVIDTRGIIRYKHIGPVTTEVLDEIILPLLRDIGEES